jgi:hypothetical protein
MTKQWPDERSLRYAAVAAFCGACAKVGIADGLREFLERFGQTEIKSAQAPVTTLGYWISDLPTGTGRAGRTAIPVVMGAVSSFDTTRLVPRTQLSQSRQDSSAAAASVPVRLKSPARTVSPSTGAKFPRGNSPPARNPAGNPPGAYNDARLGPLNQ